MKITLEFKINDLWIGVFWRRSIDQLDVWICLVPCFPIHITFPKPVSSQPQICPQADYDGLPCDTCNVKNIKAQWTECPHEVVSERGPEWWKKSEVNKT